jgi:heat-inducible transcriptional repressor
MQLTPRQNQILKAIVDEYISTAEPIASEQLEKKYNLGVSPATIRNEMVALTSEGLLKQPHTSAGRVPTSMALRFYVDNLMQEKELSVAEEVSAKEKVWDSRFHFDHLMRQSALALAAQTNSLAVATTKDGDIYYSGIANILDMPEFYDIDVTRTLLTLLDQQTRLNQLFYDRTYSEDPIHIIFGSDLGWPYFDPVGMAFTHFNAGSDRKGTLAIVGPCRLNFPKIIPSLRYFSNLISSLNSNW